MTNNNWKNGDTVSESQYDLIKRSIKEHSIRKTVTCITTSVILIIGIVLLMNISHGKLAGCAICIAIMLIMAIVAYGMTQTRIEKTILQKDFTWRNASCQSVKYSQSIPRRYSYGSVILDDGSSYDTMQLIHAFKPGQDVIIVSIGQNNGAKYVFTAPNRKE